MKPELQEKLDKCGIRYEAESGLWRIQEMVHFSPISENSALQPIPDVTPKEIFPVIRAMTGDKITRNYTYYPRKELIGDEESNTGLSSWIRPYPIPVILNHLDTPSFGSTVSEPLGRIHAVRYEKGAGGAGYLALVPRITDEEAIRKILDGRYHTVSIGTAASEVECSICGRKLISQDWCEHEKGETYPIKQQDGSFKNEVCYYIILGPRARELSFVNTPSDNEAAVEQPDLGTDGFQVWANKSGTLSTLTEMVSGKSAPVQEALNGFLVAENTEKKVANMNPEQEPKESTTTENKPEISLNNIEEITTAVADLYERATKGEDVEPEMVDRVKEAADKAGISSKHSIRVELSATEGVPVISNEVENIWSIFAEELEISEKQKTLSAKEYIEASEKAMLTLWGEKNTLQKELTDSKEVNTTLQEKLKTWEEQGVETLTERVETAQAAQKEAEEESHRILVQSVAVEALRAKDPLTKGKNLEQVIEALSKRTNDSLTDRLNDFLADLTSPEEDKPNAQNVEVVDNPAAVNRATKNDETGVVDKISSLYQMMEKKRPTSAQVSNPTAEVTETEREQDNLLVSIENGMMTIKPVDDKTIEDLVKEQSIDLDSLK